MTRVTRISIVRTSQLSQERIRLTQILTRALVMTKKRVTKLLR